MIVKVFSVFDSKAEAFIQPFFSQTSQTALRAFHQAAQQENHQFNQFAGDFTLFELGEFDDNDASFRMLDTPHNLGLAITLKAVEG